MMEIRDLTEETILQKKIYEEIYSIKNDLERAEKKNELLVQARKFRMTTFVSNQLKEYDKELKRKEKEEKKKASARFSRITEFDEDDTPDKKSYPPMYCGTWVANEDGIWTADADSLGAQACYHPIIPIKRLKNIESGEEQIVIAFKRNQAWSELTVPKAIIAKASAITDLARYGVAVNSENAKLLVKYLADIENWNEDIIPVMTSSSKLGWRNNCKVFLPYDAEIVFDGEYKFSQLYESIKEEGDYETWLCLMRAIRSSPILEPKIALAASFASVLVRRLDILPFICDLWGATEGGKTVTLMVAASVWANPGESRFIGDYKTTDVALEMRCDMLNSLPLILDDSSNASAKMREAFETLVYNLCSGKGKSRSNKDLGQNRESYWQNCTITNGERPLSSYVAQGGAINRILEIECGEKLFDDPRLVAETVKRNYGFAGRRFIECVKGVGDEELAKLHQMYEEELSSEESMAKQVMALATVLAADALATEFIFQDGNGLTSKEVQDFLTKKSHISEGARCYQYILDVLDESGQHFWGLCDPDRASSIDMWGEYRKSDNTVRFFIHAFESILKREGYTRKQFTSWAKNKDLLIAEKNRDTLKTRFIGESIPKWCICLKIDHDFEDKADNIEVDGIFT